MDRWTEDGILDYLGNLPALDLHLGGVLKPMPSVDPKPLFFHQGDARSVYGFSRIGTGCQRTSSLPQSPG